MFKFNSPRFRLSIVALLLFAGVAVAQTTLGQMGSAQQLAWSSSSNGSTAADLILLRESAGVLSQRNGTNAQELRVYNTRTDASNGEWGALRWNANVLEIGTYANGTGTIRNVKFAGGGANVFSFGSSIVRLDGNGSIALGSVGGGEWSSFDLNSTGFIRLGNDIRLSRAAAGVLGASNGSASAAAWLQNTAGRARLTANATNATATPSNLTDLTLPQGGGNLTAGRKYAGILTITANNSTAAEGLAFDFNGGTATWTSFQANIMSTPPVSGIVVGVSNTTAIGTALTVTTASTGDAGYVIHFSGVVNAAGTLIPRFAEVSHTSGTATAKVNSWIWADDMPN